MSSEPSKKSTSKSGRVPPQNLDAEASLLGAILIDEDVLTRVSDHVHSEDFYDARHRTLFEAMLTLYEHHQPVDLLTLTDQLKKKDQLDSIGGTEYVSELTNLVPTAAHAEHYAEIITQKAMRRRLIKASTDIATLGFDEERPISELLEKAEAEIFAVSDKNMPSDLVSLEQILAENFDRLEELSKNKNSLRGVRTGYQDLDTKLAGFQRSDLIILAGRPSMGKSAFALNLAHNIAVQEKQAVLMFSLEMSKDQLVERMLADEAGVDSFSLRTGKLVDEDWERISNAMGVLAEAPIYIDDTPGLSVLDMRTKARRQMHSHPLGLIVVDYLQLMSGAHRNYSDNRVQEISEISRGLKLIARELNVPVLALSQLSRTVESRNPPHPQLSDLRESGCLTGDTLITLASTGARVPIRDLAGKKDFTVWALNESTLKLEARPVSNAFSTGRKPIYKMTTRLGRTIRATANHKFRTLASWERLDSLKQGDRIALPRRMPDQTTNTMQTAEAALLGHLIGDGCTLPRHAIQYTTAEKDIAEIVTKLAETIFGEHIRPWTKRERQWYQVYLPAARRLTHGVRNPIALWLDQLGVFGLRSYEKYVPDLIFQQNHQTIATFLKHLWSTDGCVSFLAANEQPRPIMYYASSSLRLAQDVQSLLLHFGINATLRSSNQGKKGRLQYHVTITGQADQLLFIEKIGAVGARKKKSLAACQRFILTKTANTNRDTIPHTVWRNFAAPAMQAAGMTTRAMQGSLGMSYMGTGLYKQNLSRERIGRLARAIGNEPHLMTLATSDVYWDSVISIEADGEEEAYDLTVPELNNFIANDVIVHNSIEQDADIVMFIYREDYYKPETDRQHVTDIMIRKHRSGPTGTVELYFDMQRQKFLSLDKRHE